MQPSKIAVHFYTSIPGRYPGERGFLTTTELHFRDASERITRLSKGVDRLRVLRHETSKKALALRGIQQRIWFWRERRLASRQVSLEERAKQAITRTCLNRPLGELELQVSHSGSPFRRLTHALEVRGLLEKLAKGDYIRIYTPTIRE